MLATPFAALISVLHFHLLLLGLLGYNRFISALTLVLILIKVNERLDVIIFALKVEKGRKEIGA